jgi:hypothetical protein
MQTNQLIPDQSAIKMMIFLSKQKKLRSRERRTQKSEEQEKLERLSFEFDFKELRKMRS